MAEHFRFFDAVETNGQYDREYNAQEFTDYFKALVTTGVMKGAGNQLAVTANGSNMVSSINTGIAFILGRFYENDSPLTFTHDTETLGLNRIDRIVIRMDQNVDARHVKAFLKKGTASSNPVPPTLTQNNTVYEISLAQVRIVGGQTFIAVNAVTDERGTNIICPWAGSNILPSFDDNALAEHIEIVASTTQEGHVRLNNTLTSISVSEAATANTVKQVNDKIDGQWVTIPHASPFDHADASYYPTRIKKVGSIAVVEGFLKVGRAITSNTLVPLPEGYRTRITFSFNLYRQRAAVYEHTNGVCNGSQLLIESAEMSKYAIGDYIQFQVVYAINS